jgi:hypothetical protein
MIKKDGLLLKRVYTKGGDKGELLLVSTNPSYETYFIPLTAVVEIWEFVLRFSAELIDE